MVSVRLVVSLAFVTSTQFVGAAGAQTVAFGTNMPQAMAHYRVGNEYLARELWEQAREAFAAALHREPLFTDAHYGLGQAYMGLQRYTSAIQTFERLIIAARRLHTLELRRADRTREAPTFEVPPLVLLSLGSAHFRNGDAVAAEHYWREAVKVRPSFGEAWNNLAVVYLNTGRPQDAATAVKNAERAGFRVSQGLKTGMTVTKK